MFDTLGTLLDRIQGLVSKAFLLVGFLPAAVFLGLNLALASWAFPRVGGWAAAVFAVDAAEAIPRWLGAFVLTCLLGLVFWSLNPLMRQVMEGRYFLTEGLRQTLMQVQLDKLKAKRDQIREMLPDLFAYRKARHVKENGRPAPESWRAELREARIKPSQAAVNQSRVAKLKGDYDQLYVLQKEGRPIPFGKLEPFFAALKAELEATSDAAINADATLDELPRKCIDLLSYAGDGYESRHTRLMTEVMTWYPRDAEYLGPTRMANLAQVHREYGLNRYGLDMEVFWLRLLKVIKEDANYFPLLEEAKTQLDLSVAATSLLFVTTSVWLVLGVFADSYYPFVVAAAVGPLAVVIFYRVVLENYRAFSEAVRGAVDLYRLKLLRALHVALPPNSAAERETWTRLMMWGTLGDQAQIVYEHDAGAAAGAAAPDDVDALRVALRRFLEGP